MSLVDRLVLGTARLAGGASEREALAIVRCALDAGVRHVDTAPSYGMGTAEAVVGKALTRFGGDVAVTAKLGSVPPSFPVPRSVLRRIKRALGGSRRAPFSGDTAPPTRLVHPVGNDFTPRAMAGSLARSQAALGRVDFLLLHDITVAEATAEVVAALADLAEGAGGTPGHASLAQFDPALAARLPAGSVTQCAISPGLLLGSMPPPATGPLFLHSIAAAAAHCRAVDAGFAAALDRAGRIVGGGEGEAGRIAAALALAAARAPAARLLVASSHRDRLAVVLAALDRIDRAGMADEIVAAWGGQDG